NNGFNTPIFPCQSTFSSLKHTLQPSSDENAGLGADAPWTPTLIEIVDDKVIAKTGAAMGLAMTSRLGLRGSWRILQKLGALRQRSAENNRGSERGVSRNVFLRSAAGVALGISILASSGTAAVAGPVKNRRSEHWFDQLSGTSKEDLTGGEALAAWKASSGSSHMSKLMGLESVGAESRTMLSAGIAGVAVSEEIADAPTVKGVRHALNGGGSMVAVSYVHGDVVVATYDVTTRSGTTRRLTRVYRITGPETSRLMAEADDGVATDIAALRDNQPSPTASGCPDCMYRRCDEQNWGCVQGCCWGCAFACGNPGSCIACAVIACPWCVSLNYCNRSSCYPIVRCGPY
ncbi:hypothetical protein, partial [Arthrobacter sp. CG_A4]|uniref:hypothetical protein n=1 Tax=Arthrobacter sp. CG_A4 TaxID=3071706 RepID=UPI002E090AC9|nr:hypothetical protein [Arthrobacter sp. CG_A4]